MGKLYLSSHSQSAWEFPNWTSPFLQLPTRPAQSHSDESGPGTETVARKRPSQGMRFKLLPGDIFESMSSLHQHKHPAASHRWARSLPHRGRRPARFCKFEEHHHDDSSLGSLSDSENRDRGGILSSNVGFRLSVTPVLWHSDGAIRRDLPLSVRAGYPRRRVRACRTGRLAHHDAQLRAATELFRSS